MLINYFFVDDDVNKIFHFTTRGNNQVHSGIEEANEVEEIDKADEEARKVDQTEEIAKEKANQTEIFEFLATPPKEKIALQFSKKYNYDDRTLADTLATALLKMMRNQSHSTEACPVISFSQNLPFVTPNQKKFSEIELKLTGFPAVNTTKFYLLKPASHGAEGHCLILPIFLPFSNTDTDTKTNKQTKIFFIKFGWPVIQADTFVP